jgi:hypothetical protein
MSAPLSDPDAPQRHNDQNLMDIPPLDPAALSHYLAACKVARVPVADTSVADLHALIARVSRLSIPDAAKLLRKVQP